MSVQNTRSSRNMQAMAQTQPNFNFGGEVTSPELSMKSRGPKSNKIYRPSQDSKSNKPISVAKINYNNFNDQ